MWGPKYTIEVVSEDGAVTFSLSGELDIATVEDLTGTFAEIVDGTKLVVDLTEVTFLDSAGLDVFVRLKADHPDMEFITNSRVDRVLQLAGLDTYFRGRSGFRSHSVGEPPRR